MEIAEILEQVKEICRKDNVSSLVLAGSLAKGTSHPKSDIDIAVYGDFDYFVLADDLDKIDTLRKIDIIDMNTLRNKALEEDIQRYGKVLY